LEMDKYTDLVRTKSLEISITFNEMYFLHDLLQSRIASLAPNSLEPLCIILQELGTAPPQLPRKDNTSVDLPLINQFEKP